MSSRGHRLVSQKRRLRQGRRLEYQSPLRQKHRRPARHFASRTGHAWICEAEGYQHRRGITWAAVAVGVMNLKRLP